MSGLPIEKGDRYFIGAFADDGRVHSIKAHSVLQDMAHDSMDRHGDDNWDPECPAEYLLAWLELHLGHRHPDARICCQAALEFWHAGNGRKRCEQVPW